MDLLPQQLLRLNDEVVKRHAEHSSDATEYAPPMTKGELAAIHAIELRLKHGPVSAQALCDALGGSKPERRMIRVMALVAAAQLAGQDSQPTLREVCHLAAEPKRYKTKEQLLIRRLVIDAIRAGLIFGTKNPLYFAGSVLRLAAPVMADLGDEACDGGAFKREANLRRWRQRKAS